MVLYSMFTCGHCRDNSSPRLMPVLFAKPTISINHEGHADNSLVSSSMVSQRSTLLSAFSISTSENGVGSFHCHALFERLKAARRSSSSFASVSVLIPSFLLFTLYLEIPFGVISLELKAAKGFAELLERVVVPLTTPRSLIGEGVICHITLF